jgi:hypothetical protein
MPIMTIHIRRSVDVPNLVRELAENKVDALELIREGLSNAKDHGADRVWIHSFRDDPRDSPSVTIIDNGDGMSEERLEAFWGVGASRKGERRAIGYKGHGTKLFFASQRLSVATRTAGDAGWRISTVNSPSEMSADFEIPLEPLQIGHPLHAYLASVGILDRTGSVILIEHVQFNDAERLLQRRRIESFCDWFTVIGDIRSGLFDERLAFHRVIAEGGASLAQLRLHECDLRAIQIDLCINGEKQYTPLGLGPTAQDKEFFAAWPKDLEVFKDQPALLALGHRFADRHESTGGTKRARDDTTSLRLTGPNDWATEEGYAVVARVEGHRRQRETYLEAQWQGKKGVYGFDARFGLWLCRDFMPLVRRNDLLQDALNMASKTRLQLELDNLRNWQVFVNSQSLLPTANRGGISNQSEHDQQVIKILADVLEKAFKEAAFRDWVAKLRAAKLSGLRDREVADMDDRRSAVRTWIEDKRRDSAIDPMTVADLPLLDPQQSLLMRAPASEQELFYVYGLLSGRYEMPLHVLEYDASRGVDAIALLRHDALVSPRTTHVRVEFKHLVSAHTPIDHFFDAIDIIVCWKVDRIGDIYEQNSGGRGSLRRRPAPILTPPIDTYEIEYTEGMAKRVIPVLEISALFAPNKPAKKSPWPRTR